jgi:hypothetical protein
MAIYAFEGPTELYVHRSASAAQRYFEAIDVENDEYVFFGDDGTAIQPSVLNGRVVLTPTEENRVEELRQRLRAYLRQDSVAMDPERAEDTVALASLLLERERGHSTAGWLRRGVGRRQTS